MEVSRQRVGVELMPGLEFDGAGCAVDDRGERIIGLVRDYFEDG